MVGRIDLIDVAGSIVAALLRKCILTLLLLLSLLCELAASADRLFSVQGCVPAVEGNVCSSWGRLAPRQDYLLAPLILAAVHASSHLPLLHYSVGGSGAGDGDGLIGYYGGNFGTSRSRFEHSLADTDGLLLERVLRPGRHGHVLVGLTVHLQGILLRLITSVIGLSLCEL